MKYLFYILILNLFFTNHLAAQCVDADASIWKDTWASCEKTANPKAEYGNSHWIQYNFGSARNLSKTWVWNTNDPIKLEQGFNLVKIDYSEDGQNWTYFGEMSFPKAKGESVYSGFTGPDLQNIKAQYVLITAISNHGNTNCAGLAEIKFNLMPEDGVAIPETEEPTDDDDDDENVICSAIDEIIVEEVLTNEAFLFWEFESEADEVLFLLEYQAEGSEIIAVETTEAEVFLENLMPNTSYEYRVSILCGEEWIASEIGSFATPAEEACAAVENIEIGEISSTEAFIFWEGNELYDFYLVQFGVANEDKEEGDIEDAELFLEDLSPATNYEFSVGVECGVEVIWSNPISFTTAEEENEEEGEEEEDDVLSTGTTNKLVFNPNIQLFPNPTQGPLTFRFKTIEKDILNYSILDIKGRILYRNSTKVLNGINTIKMDLFNFTDGVYWLNGVTINGREKVSKKIVKVSK